MPLGQPEQDRATAALGQADAGDGHAAGETAARHRARGQEPQAFALDEPFAATRAVGGTSGRTPHVADIDIVKSCFTADGIGPFQRFRRRRRPVAHGKIGMKPRDVPGRVRAKLLDQKCGQFRQLPGAVVAARDKQRRHLQPPAELPDAHEIFKHWFEPRPADALVEIRTHGLEIDVGRVNAPGQRVQAGRALEAVGDQDVSKALGLGAIGRFGLVGDECA